MRTITILIVFCIIHFTAFAQDTAIDTTGKPPHVENDTVSKGRENYNNSKLALGIVGGAGFPLPYYCTTPNLFQAHTDFRNPSYCAEIGVHFGIHADVMFSYHLGVMVMALGTINPIDESGYVAKLSNGDPLVTTSIKTTSYYVGQYFIGFTPTFYSESGAKLQLVAGGGILTLSYPKIVETDIVRWPPNNTPRTVTQIYNPYTDYGFGWYFGIDFSKRIYKSFSGVISLSYVGTKLGPELIEPSLGISYNL